MLRNLVRGTPCKGQSQDLNSGLPNSYICPFSCSSTLSPDRPSLGPCNHLSHAPGTTEVTREPSLTHVSLFWCPSRQETQRVAPAMPQSSSSRSLLVSQRSQVPFHRALPRGQPVGRGLRSGKALGGGGGKVGLRGHGILGSVPAAPAEDERPVSLIHPALLSQRICS